MKNLSIIFILTIGFIIVGCGSDTKNQETPFDRKALLTNYANNVFPVKVDAYANAVNRLSNKINILTENPSIDNFKTARAEYMNAIESWESIAYLNIGSGAKEGLKLSAYEEMAMFPISTTSIENKIEANTFDIDDSVRSSRGLLAIEYLLFGKTDISEAYELLKNPTRLAYLKAITEKLHNQTKDFQEGWTTYKTEFINNDGTTVTSSITTFYNAWVQSYEQLKNMKITMPLGLEAGQLAPAPALVESRYAMISLDLAKVHFEGIVDAYHGGDGLGLDDYLKSVDGGQELVDRTEAQISKIRKAFEAVPKGKTLQELAIEENAEIKTLHNELQTLIPLIKSETSSLLGLTITYSSSDGD